MNKERDLGIDVLKFIGLIGLIASHTFINDVILQIRSFDVNLLVIISAYLADKNESNNNISYTTYCKKRIKRLLFPTWIFITVYFIVNTLLKFQNYSILQIVRSYLLLNNSIGYVWIIYVYLICAVAIPLLKKVDTKSLYSKVLFIGITIIYLWLTSITDNYWYQLVVLYPIIYSLISLIGIFIARNETKFSTIIMISGLIVFIVYAIILYNMTGIYIVTGEYKYPPKLYYLGYSIGISILLFNFKSVFLKLINAVKMVKIVLFVSKHSLWLYLWHILALQVVMKFKFNQILSFLIVIIISIFLILIQEKIVQKLKSKGVSDNVLSLFKG